MIQEFRTFDKENSCVECEPGLSFHWIQECLALEMESLVPPERRQALVVKPKVIQTEFQLFWFHGGADARLVS